MPARIDRDELIDALQTLAANLGHAPTRREMAENGRYSPTPYYRVFGSWNSALEAADIPIKHRQKISDEQLLSELQDVADQLGHVPREKDMNREGKFSATTYRRRFGSFLDARAKAGLTDVKVQRDQQIPEEDLILALHMLTRELGRPPSQSEMNERGVFSSTSYHRHFGSWNAALEAADLALE